MIESASSTDGVPKLLTWREHCPAPRSSTTVSSARTRLNGNGFDALACGRAMRAPAVLVTVKIDDTGTYEKSVGPAKGPTRPDRKSSFPAHSTWACPDSGSTSHSC